MVRLPPGQGQPPSGTSSWWRSRAFAAVCQPLRSTTCPFRRSGRRVHLLPRTRMCARAHELSHVHAHTADERNAERGCAARGVARACCASEQASGELAWHTTAGRCRYQARRSTVWSASRRSSMPTRYAICHAGTSTTACVSTCGSRRTQHALCASETSVAMSSSVRILSCSQPAHQQSRSHTGTFLAAREGCIGVDSELAGASVPSRGSLCRLGFHAPVAPTQGPTTAAWETGHLFWVAECVVTSPTALRSASDLPATFLRWHYRGGLPARAACPAFCHGRRTPGHVRGPGPGGPCWHPPPPLFLFARPVRPGAWAHRRVRALPLGSPPRPGPRARKVASPGLARPPAAAAQPRASGAISGRTMRLAHLAAKGNSRHLQYPQCNGTRRHCAICC